MMKALFFLLIFSSCTTGHKQKINDESFGACGCRIWKGSERFTNNLFLIDDGEKVGILVDNEMLNLKSQIREVPEYFQHQLNESYKRSDIQNDWKIQTEWKCISSIGDESGPSSVSKEYEVDVTINDKFINEHFVGYCGC
ncbi:MAG: hypothetical protein K9K67_12430 [Bacteriovoracaceae bacterium]|nr:hypothetical protein [Bacteriovoracaceae bacterium]